MTTEIVKITNIDANTILHQFELLFDNITEINKKVSVKDNKYLTVKETAEFFSVSDVTIWQWTKKGLLKSYKIANRKYYKQSEIENALTEMNA